MIGSHSARLAAVALAAALAAAGCGSSDTTTTNSTGAGKPSTPAGTTSPKPTKPASGEKKVVVMPDLTGTGVYEAQCELARLRLGWSIDGRKPSSEPEAACDSLDTATPIPNPPVAAQKPKPGTKLLTGGVIGLATTCANQRAPETGPYCLPGQPGSP